MTWQIAVVLGLGVVAILLFASEKLPADVIALLLATTVVVTGIVTPEEGLAGFANVATVTVGAMFVLSAGLARTGAVDWVGRFLNGIASRGLPAAHVAMMLSVGTLSAFLNNTAAVAILIPVVIGVARKRSLSPSKLLMPLSFASMFGGVCTLIGTSTNVLASSIAERHGYPAFGLFEFSLLGLIFFAAGVTYMLTAGRLLVPARRDDAGLTRAFGIEYLTEVVLGPEARSVGKTIAEAPLLLGSGIEVVRIVRDGKPNLVPAPDTTLRSGDALTLLCTRDDMVRIKDRVGVSFATTHLEEDDLQSKEMLLVEGVVAPNSRLSGKAYVEADFRGQFGGTALAVRPRGEPAQLRLNQLRLRPGDALLVEIPRDRLSQLRQSGVFLLVSQSPVSKPRRSRIAASVAIMFGVVVLSASGLAPIAVSAMLGALAMVLLGCLTTEEAYEAIDWRILFLLAGMLALGAAMEKSGAAKLLAERIVSGVGWLGPVAVLSALYLLTSILTEVMTNNAAIALLAPIAIATAEALGLSARPLLIAVMFAGSSSFMTPVGYQTNTMIYGPGHYRFMDFMKVGAPLNLLFWLLATFLIPVFFPF